jgi:hypothetical protein
MTEKPHHSWDLTLIGRTSVEMGLSKNIFTFEFSIGAELAFLGCLTLPTGILVMPEVQALKIKQSHI